MDPMFKLAIQIIVLIVIILCVCGGSGRRERPLATTG
jgi:hypothetical protein